MLRRRMRSCREAATIDASERKSCDVPGASALQNRSTGSQRGPGCKYVVDQEHAPAFDLMRTAQVEGGAGIRTSLGFGKAGLRRSKCSAAEVTRELQPAALSHGLGEQFGLVEAALPALAPVHRNSHDQVKALMQRQSANEQTAERRRKSFDFAVFKKVNELPEGTIVTAERVSRVEVHGTLAADATEILFIERMGVEEGRAAGATEKFGY